MKIISELSSHSPKESYYGQILTLQDAVLVIEATRLNILPKVKRKLNNTERANIRAGSVFIWNETECGIKRWRDGKIWLVSRMKGPFLIYQEYDVNRNVKPEGLIKKSFSLTTRQNERFRLISYYSVLGGGNPGAGAKVPSQDKMFARLVIDPHNYLNRIPSINSPDSRVQLMLPQDTHQPPMQQVPYLQPMDSPLPGIPIYYPAPTTYIVPHPHYPTLPVYGTHQLPQQLFYLRLVGPHGYWESYFPNITNDRSRVFTQSVNSAISFTSFPIRELSTLNSSPPPTG